MAQMMKAAVLYQAGAADSFVIEDVPVPDVGPGDVLVQVKASGVSFRDVVERNGTYRRDVTWPAILGLEISGTVVAFGRDVQGLAIGDHVCSKAFISCGQCRLCRSGRETTCKQRKPVKGGYAEFAALPADAWVKVSSSLPFEISCSLGPSAGVALNALRDTAHVEIGDVVLVSGASGGVGVPSVQIAKAAGAKVIAVTRDAAKRAFLESIGADHVIIAESGENFAPQVRALTDGAGADVVVDNVGSRVFNACFDSLAVHGRYALVGQLFGEEVSINPARIFFKRAQILGVGSVSRAQLSDAAELAARGIVTPKIQQTMPLEQVGRAHALVEEGAVSGRIVLTP